MFFLGQNEMVTRSRLLVISHTQMTAVGAAIVAIATMGIAFAVCCCKLDLELPLERSYQQRQTRVAE